MREAIGATWLFGIVITFIALFSGYLAFSVNYSKAFKVKDGIVERLQKHNGLNKNSVNDITDFLSNIGYNSSGRCDTNNNIQKGIPYIGITETGEAKKQPNTEGSTDATKYNYCIQKVSTNGATGQLSSGYYKVVVFFSLSVPVINLGTNFSVSGETSNIYYPYEDLNGI